MSVDYETLTQVDRGLGRASLRRATYAANNQPVSVAGQTAVIDRLLDRRLVLMAERDAATVTPSVAAPFGRTNP